MITTLHIKNIGIIGDLTIDFNKGLNVLTGETGAGKTLIIDSLAIICGGRFLKEMIRKGEKNSYVELCMYEPQSKESIDGNIIITREININGKNMCKINGRMVTVNELREFMGNYIEIHGQNDNQKLINSKNHLEYLDDFMQNDILENKEKYKKLYQEYIKIKYQLKENFGDEKERERKLDLLKYQFDEIEQANLQEDEGKKLEEKRKIFINSEKISESLNEADILIGENAIECLSNTIRVFEKIENIDNKYEKIGADLKNIYYEMQEISRDVNSYKNEIYFDEEERNEIEERLDLIYSLKRKYGNTTTEIIEYKRKIQSEIERIENLEGYNSKLREKLKTIEQELIKIARIMHKKRVISGNLLSDNINKELKDLEMKNAIITVDIKYCDEEFYSTGKDVVSFYISTNIGEDKKELSKIASGGEMSRIMLAIKKVLADTDKMPVLIFDEIDTGISGKAANSVAEKLSKIADNHQIICISHLPNIAAVADFNYFISKEVNNNRTNTKIKLLKEDEIINEIARISSGDINEITIKYATELRNKKVS